MKLYYTYICTCKALFLPSHSNAYIPSAIGIARRPTDIDKKLCVTGRYPASIKLPKTYNNTGS